MILQTWFFFRACTGNDVARSMLIFAKGKPLGPHGLDWLKIHLVNLTGFKKRFPHRNSLMSRECKLWLQLLMWMHIWHCCVVGSRINQVKLHYFHDWWTFVSGFSVWNVCCYFHLLLSSEKLLVVDVGNQIESVWSLPMPCWMKYWIQLTGLLM